MKISRYFIVLGLLAGGLAPIGLGLSAHKNAQEVKAETKDLSTIVSPGSKNFSLSNIGNFFFDFTTSEQIFSRTGYMNDHLNEFLDENGNPINLADGIIINGQTFGYWINYTPDPISYPRNSGVCAFPLYAGKVFNPVSIEVTTSKLAFKVNLDYMPMDSIVVTFKAGVFKGYNNGTTYTLSEDLTFYSTLNETVTSSNSDKISFVKARNETIINAQITAVNDWGEKTNSQGGKFHRYVLWTNTPRDKTHVGDTFPATHYRYVYDNYMLNGKSFTTINSWARGNSKDFTDLSDATSITAEYEASKPGGAISINECLALTIEHPSDQDNYVAIVYVPNQLLTDLSIATPSFTLRDGSAWFTKDANGNPMIGRINREVFNNMVSSAATELENYPNLALYNDAQKLQIASIISDAQTSMLDAFTQADLTAIVDNTKVLIDAVETSEEALQQQHIDEVVALIDAIITPVEYTEECGSSINAAKEAFANLTASEIAKFPSAKLDALYDAYAVFSELDLANFKELSKAEITAKYDINEYRELEQSAIADLVAIANTDIDNANNKAEVQSAVESFATALKSVPTDKQLAEQELKDAKSSAKAELDAIDLSAYRDAERAQVQELITNGKIAIDQCETIVDVQTLLNKIKTVIGSIKTDAELSGVQAANATREAKQKATVITLVTVGCSFTLVLGISLAICFIRKRKTN